MISKFIVFCSLFFSAVCFTTNLNTVEAPHYEVIEITAPNASWISGEALNACGEVVGHITIGGQDHIFKWSRKENGVTFLNIPVDIRICFFNSQGQIAGTYNNDVPFLWDPGTGFHDLGANGKISSVNGLTEAGDVLMSDGESCYIARLNSPLVPILGPSDQPIVSNGHQWFAAINSHNQVAYSSVDPKCRVGLFSITTGEKVSLLNSMTDNYLVMGINDAGDIIGLEWQTQSGFIKFAGRPKQTIPLGWPQFINNHGQIVGDNAFGGGGGITLYEGGNVLDLGAIVWPSDPTSANCGVFGLNNNGQIGVTFSVNNGHQVRAVLLNPIQN